MMRRRAATARWVLPVPGSPIRSRPGLGPSGKAVGVVLDGDHDVAEFGVGAAWMKFSKSALR